MRLKITPNPDVARYARGRNLDQTTVMLCADGRWLQVEQQRAQLCNTTRRGHRRIRRGGRGGRSEMAGHLDQSAVGEMNLVEPSGKCHRDNLEEALREVLRHYWILGDIIMEPCGDGEEIGPYHGEIPIHSASLGRAIRHAYQVLGKTIPVM